jgi:hypothetical protein
MKIYVHHGFLNLILETVNEDEREREREIVLPMQVNFLVDGAERKMIPKTNRKVSSELFVFCIH